MKVSPLLLIFIALVVFVCCQKKEKFVEIFAPAGYTKPVDSPEINYDQNFDDSEFNNTSDLVTPDEINTCIQAITPFVLSQTGLCVVPLDVNQIDIYKNPSGNKLYKLSTMLMVKNVGFPFGFSLNVSVFNGKVVKASSQIIEKPTNISSYTTDLDDNFMDASALLSVPKSM